MTDTDFHARRTMLANAFAAAGAEFLGNMPLADAAIAAVPNTQPQRYAVVGEPKAIRALLPNDDFPARRMRKGARPDEELYWGPEAGQPRRWSILITEGGKGVVADYGYRFPEASAELERVDVVEASPATANKAEVEPVAWAFAEGLERLARVRDGYADSPLLVVYAAGKGEYTVPLYATLPATTGASTAPSDDEVMSKYAQIVAYPERLTSGDYATAIKLVRHFGRVTPASTVLTDERISAGARWLSNHQADACGVDREDNWKVYGNQIIEEFRKACEVAFGTPVAAQAGQVAPADAAGPLSDSNARFAIDAAIMFGREGVNRPPTDDHWLFEYWNIGQQLAQLGATSGWDNVTPIAVASEAGQVAVPGDGDRIMQALTTGISLREPVYTWKALLAQREAKVVLDKGIGPVAAVHLVNIGLTGWVHTKETAEAYAEGYNTALKEYRAALLSVAPSPAKESK